MDLVQPYMMYDAGHMLHSFRSKLSTQHLCTRITTKNTDPISNYTLDYETFSIPSLASKRTIRIDWVTVT